MRYIQVMFFIPEQSTGTRKEKRDSGYAVPHPPDASGSGETRKRQGDENFEICDLEFEFSPLQGV